MSRSVKSEIERRQTNTEKVYALFTAHRGIWLTPHELASVGGFSAWRTRVSEARELALKHDEEIVWNKKDGAESAYMLRPKSLGPSAETDRTAQRTLPGLGISSLHR